MKLNAAEKALMKYPVRATIQRHHEAPLLEWFGGTVDGAHVLEVGCGRGVGTQIILDRFGAEHVAAFDLDADMVQRARRRLKRRCCIPGRRDSWDAPPTFPSAGRFGLFGVLGLPVPV